MTEARVRGRQQLVLLAILFFAPLAAAIVLYFFAPQWQPEGHTNYGQLVQPAQPLPDLALRGADGAEAGEGALRGKWSFVYVGTDRCDASCQQKLYQIRQVRTLLNEKRLRVQRVYLAPDVEALTAARTLLAADHPDLKFLAEPAQGDTLRGVFAAGPLTGDAQALYLVDPLGNWMMVYPGIAEYKGILKDIKRLLRVSQIG
jgi:cytochrome oxidase Cu insertion factor (SCO1/SenC/PrrC family)